MDILLGIFIIVILNCIFYNPKQLLRIYKLSLTLKKKNKELEKNQIKFEKQQIQMGKDRIKIQNDCAQMEKYKTEMENFNSEIQKNIKIYKNIIQTRSAGWKFYEIKNIIAGKYIDFPFIFGSDN